MLGNKNVPLTEILVNKMVLQLRFPRLISLYLTGFLLSVSGFIVQIMTRNPIAEMATLGFLRFELGFITHFNFGLVNE